MLLVVLSLVLLDSSWRVHQYRQKIPAMPATIPMPQRNVNCLLAWACSKGQCCRVGEKKACPVGTYCPNDHLFDHLPCYPEMFNFRIGQEKCSECPIGAYCPAYGVVSSTEMQCNLLVNQAHSNKVVPVTRSLNGMDVSNIIPVYFWVNMPMVASVNPLWAVQEWRPNQAGRE